MKRSKAVMVLLVMLLAAVLTGCATFQKAQVAWDKLDSDQQARIITAGIQAEVGKMFDAGQTYVKTNPQYDPVWKAKIVPVFNSTNKLIAVWAMRAKTGGVTYDTILTSLQPAITELTNLLASIGAIKK